MRFLGLVGFLAGLLTSVAAHSAPLKPPSESLRGPGVMLVAGAVGKVDAQGRLVLDQVEVLQGEPAAVDHLLELRTEPWVVDRVLPGERIVVGYATLTRDPEMGRRWIPDPEGPRTVVSSGLEPAIFADGPATRERLLDAAGKLRAPAFEETIAGIEDNDPRWQYYYVAELVHRTALTEALNPDHRQVLQRVLESTDSHPAARTLLLNFAPKLAVGDGWWKVGALSVVAGSPVTHIDSAEWPQATLVLVAFERMRVAGHALPTAIAARWLRSDVPALAEAALLAVRESEPELERPLILEARSEALTPIHTRRFLDDHLRRLDLMEKSLAEQDH
jgi:hypothetical protein